MTRALLIAVATVALALPAAQAAAQTAERLYIMDCGHNAAIDQARWSPGINVGKPLELSDNCYLIQHGSQLLLWDTGYPDALADKPLTSPIGTATRSKRLADQLTELKLTPADITWLAVSHTHGDHVGNVDMFPKTPLVIQKAELDWAFADGKPAPFKKDRPIKELSGDFDIFGDGSAVILATPGHTPGHQSLLVNLKRTGHVVLTGDLAHFKDNWDNDRVPSMNTSADQTHASHAKVMKVLADKKAQLWINHDKPTSVGQKHSPEFYD